MRIRRFAGSPGADMNAVGLQRLTGLLAELANCPVVGCSGRTRAASAATRAELAAVLPGTDLASLRETKLGYMLLNLASQWGITLTAPQDDELARLRCREAVLNAELAGIAAALAGSGADYLVMRGPALTRFYPTGWVRQYNDLDLLVRDDTALPTVLRRLARHGYYVARPVVSRAVATGIWRGIALNKQVDQLGHPMYLDMTSLGPALSSTRHLTVPAACWQDREMLTTAGIPVPVSGATWQVALFAAELVERRGSFVLRDVLDLAALGRGSPDWAAVRAYLQETPQAGAALGSLILLARACGELSGTSGGVPAELLDISWPRPHRSALEPRALVAATVTRGIRLAKRRSPGLARWLVERAPTRAWFALGLPVYLLPPWQTPLRGGGGRQADGWPGYRGRVYPLVPPGYSKAVFTSSVER